MVLLLGNGLNNLEDQNTTWDNLINNVSERITKKGLGYTQHNRPPLQFIYEELFLEFKKKYKHKTEHDLKKIFSDEISGLKAHPIYKKLEKLNIQTILTTNYDDLIDMHFIGSYITQEIPGDVENNKIMKQGNEWRYRIYTKNSGGPRSVWHIHGEAKHLQTMVIGQDMYMKVASKINDYLNTKKPEHKFEESWIDYFFNKNIHILGFGMDYSEITLYQILHERARRIADGGNEYTINNRIIYYCYEKEATSDKKDLIQYLKKLHIEVKEIQANDYLDFYDKVLDSFPQTNNGKPIDLDQKVNTTFDVKYERSG